MTLQFSVIVSYINKFCLYDHKLLHINHFQMKFIPESLLIVLLLIQHGYSNRNDVHEMTCNEITSYSSNTDTSVCSSDYLITTEQLYYSIDESILGKSCLI